MVTQPRKSKRTTGHAIRLTSSGLYTILLMTSLTGLWGLSNRLFPNLYINDVVYAAVFVCSVAMLLLLFFSKGIRPKIRFAGCCMLLAIVVFVELCYTLISYDQSTFSTLKQASYYIAPVLVCLTYSCLIEREEEFEAIAKIVVVSAIAISAISLIAYYAIENGNNILGLSYTLRNGSPRFSIGGIVVTLGFLISIYKVFSGERKIVHFIAICLILAEVIVVTKTRTAAAYLILMIAVTPLLLYRNRHAGMNLLFAIVAMCLLGVLIINIGLPYLNNLPSSDAHVINRLYEIEFYMSAFMQTPVLGMGFLSASGPYAALVSGTSGTYYQSDVGYVGILNLFGLLGMAWVLYFYLKAGRNALKKNNMLGIVMLVYLVISSMNLSFLDYNKTILIPFVLLFCFAFKDEVKRSGPSVEDNSTITTA